MFLLVNDDGIEAPGLAALERAMREMGPCVVVAPDRHYSGCGHQVTTKRPLTMTERGSGRFMLDGTPADCTRVGLTVLAPDARWVIAGINEGANLGADVYMSGTVAAVREGALLGRPGIAVSHYVRSGMPVDWDKASLWARAVLSGLLEKPEGGVYWNVNLPHFPEGMALPEIVRAELDTHALPVAYEQQESQFHYRGDYHARGRRPGSDVEVCFSGRIAMTRLTLG